MLKKVYFCGVIFFYYSSNLKYMENNQITDPMAEARRYVANAEEVIKRAKYDPELKSYTDSKYIKAAGDYLWKGCLIALDAVFHVR